METRAQGSVRIDLWLWYAHFFRSRSLAARAVKGSRMRLNRQVIRKVSQSLRVGDVLTIPYNGDIRVIEVAALGDRRGPAAEARALYRDRAVVESAEAAD